MEHRTGTSNWSARGKSIRENVGHGRVRTIARFDSRGLFCEGYDEGNAAFVVTCVNACAGIDPAAVPVMLRIVRELHGAAAYHIDTDDVQDADSSTDWEGIYADTSAALALAEGTLKEEE